MRVVPCPKGRDAKACLLVGDNEAKELFLYSVDAAGRVGDESRVAITAVDGGKKTPKLDDIESVRLLELASILRHALAGIDVGQHVHFEGNGCKHAGNAEQGGRSAQHQ